MEKTIEYFNRLNNDYLNLHKTKEDLFWKTYMGTSDNHDGFTQAETEYKQFISQASRISELKNHIQDVETLPVSEERDRLLVGLNGWLAFFKCHAIEDAQTKELLNQLIQQESDLFSKRKDLTLTYIDENGKTTEASTLVLSSNLTAKSDESVRKSSHEGFLELEKWVVNSGFVDMVKLRNKFARSLGYENFFDYSIQKNEAMTPKQLFDILDDFEERTRTANEKSLSQLSDKKGVQALEAHNFRYSISGDVEQEMDPYLPFSKSLERWMKTFSAMGIDYQGATLTLDLLDRKGKYENGFMHGPVPCFHNQGKWQPAEINFTSNANPDKIGSGKNALATLLHEGGHAAHFSNITLNAPCFSQEYAPSSMAFAETQSMFCDSLLGDADWLKRYAKSNDGKLIPDELIRKKIDAKQPFFAFSERSILVVPYYEWAVYSLPEDELTPDRLISLARETEQRILGLQCSPRPLLAIPHLLSEESACAYQGYLLAHMAVYQTRAWFEKKYGFITDNSEIGPLLSKCYWNPGNRITHNQSLIDLTGEGFSAQYLADECNKTPEESWQAASELINRTESHQSDPNFDILNATIKVVHGDEMIADNSNSNQLMIEQFESWINARYSK